MNDLLRLLQGLPPAEEIIPEIVKYALFVCVVYLVFTLLQLRHRRRVGMSREEKRRDFVRREVADAITDALENKVENGRLARSEVQSAYKKLGYYLKDSDFFSKQYERGRKPLETKNRVLDRLRAAFGRNGELASTKEVEQRLQRMKEGKNQKGLVTFLKTLK